jgi:hypothetical protein
MIWITDLITGLIALMDADKSKLKAPEQGYTIAGFSFNPNILQKHLKELFPSNDSLVTYNPCGAAKECSECWPDSLSDEAAKRDLDWQVSEFKDI